MRIAYIILCHTDPEHIRRLTKKITGGTDDEAFIHVDGKCDAAPFEQTLKDVPQAHFLCQRIPVYWGGYSAVEATVQLLRAALLWERSSRCNQLPDTAVFCSHRLLHSQ